MLKSDADRVPVLNEAMLRRPPLSLYLHIPFCESAGCCSACNKVITKHHAKAAECLDLLAQGVGFESIELSHLIKMRDYFKPELDRHLRADQQRERFSRIL